MDDINRQYSQDMFDAATNRIIVEVYRASRTTTEDGFQRAIFELLGQLVTFDSGCWSIGPPGISYLPHRTFAFNFKYAKRHHEYEYQFTHSSRWYT